MSFCHLHTHTEYSLLDGACKLSLLVERAKELSQTALAITDHGVMYGVIDFYKLATKAGIKPIIGCEVYVAPRSRFDKVFGRDNKPHHLVLLCENNKGYENLITLVSLAYIDGFYSKPRIDMELLSKYSEGIIALSACLAGEIPRMLSSNSFEQACQKVSEFKNIMGEDNFFIEIQNHGLDDQIKVLPDLIKLAKETNTPLVATNDVHYILKEDAKIQKVLICLQTGKTLDDDNNLEFETDEFYLKSESEMRELFQAVPEAIDNTQKIADRCNLSFEFGVTKLPAFKTPDDTPNQDYFINKCTAGLYKNYGQNPPNDILERFKYEVDTITSMGYVDYFLIVADFIEYAKNQDIPVGPGRGSGAGSIVAFCMGITGIDPIKYGLIFERFLNPERISMPDFDVDFCYERRQEVIDYVVEKYGFDHVAQIITFGTLAARSSVRDVGRVMSIPYAAVDTVAKLIPMELGITIDKALKSNTDFYNLYQQNPTANEIIETARKIEGMPRHSSMHAAGIVISKEQTMKLVPLQKNDNTLVTQFPMTTLEELGLLKMDFLGLRTLSVIKHACEFISKKSQKPFDIHTIPLDDESTYNMLSNGDTIGVFQLESSGMRRVLTKFLPRSIEDIIAIISLYRPGPMDSIPKYIQNKNDQSNITYKHPYLEEILKVTYGCIVYQEQVMQICRTLANYSYGRADLVRRAMSKKKADVMEKERQAFIDGCIENKVSEKIANDIFNEMISFASYAFNKSHAAAYAMLSYQTAYLKANYKTEFMASLMTSVIDQSDKVSFFMQEASNLNVKMLPPDINISTNEFFVGDDEIRFPLLGIKNLGKGVIESIIIEREKNGAFTSFYNLCSRMHKEINKRAMESLIYSGACDLICDEPHKHSRAKMIANLEPIYSLIENDEKNTITGQIDFFSMDNDNPSESEIYQMKDAVEFSILQMLEKEKDAIGVYMSAHPLDEFNQVSRTNRCTKISDLLDEEFIRNLADKRIGVNLLGIVKGYKNIVTKNGSNMAFFSLEDRDGSMIEVLVFANCLSLFKDVIKKDEAILISGTLTVKDDEVKILADKLYDPRLPVNCETVQQPPNNGKKASSDKLKKGIYLKMASSKCTEFNQILPVLASHNGKLPVYIQFDDVKKLTLAPQKYWVENSVELIEKLKKIVGIDNILIKN